jgi:questin oxidase-like protein
MRASLYTSMDEALKTLAPYGAELRNGNSNHAPMVAEALCAMGRPDAVMPWITQYRDRMLPRPSASDRLRREAWRGALGQRDRFAEWSAFFGEELQEAPWRQVLDRWVERLAPGCCAAATHGVIRVGHAVRSLAASETPWRLRELADALASWAKSYQELPAGDPIANGRMTPREALAKIPSVPPERRSSGNLVAALAILTDFPEFAPAIGLIDTTGEIAPLLSELTEVFARVYLANANDFATTIAFIHGVTSLAALGSIVLQVSDGSARTALRYAWQTGCALYACFGSGMGMAEEIELREQDENRLVERAIANGDQHVIKFTEACLRRHALSPSPAYFAAVHHVHGMIPRR